jgi:hypothetical protein
VGVNQSTTNAILVLDNSQVEGEGGIKKFSKMDGFIARR